VKLYDSAQMRAADAAAAAAGISVASLMEAAGARVAERLLDLFPAAPDVVVLCGAGNNGGDGYVAARRLLENRVTVEVWETTPTPRTEVARRARASFVDAGGAPVPLASADLARRLAAVADTQAVVLDALLGCGLDRPLSGTLAEVVAIINEAHVRVLAVDVPTGVSADSPLLRGPHVRADATVQLAGPKVASAFYPARGAFTRSATPDVGASVVDIGIPAAVLDELSTVTLLTQTQCARWAPRRAPTAHKYAAGTVTVVAGSESYAGAAELACRGAWRGGAGLVTLVSSQQHPAAWPETVYRDLAEGQPFPPPGLTTKAAGSCVVGPGLHAGAVADLLSAVTRWATGPIIIDAAALAPSALWPALKEYAQARAQRAQQKERGSQRTQSDPERFDTTLVLTPHAGEAGRLLDVPATAVDADPLSAATRLSQLSGAVVVLKGPTTVIAAPDGQTAVSTRGHPGMASGGTGDVLAGLLGALTSTLAVTEDDAGPGPNVAAADGSLWTTTLFQRASLAVFAHGVAGERAAARHGDSLLASDLADELAGVLGWLASVGW
jgi:NAD(P)H-hydrate epimerase